MRSTRCFSSVGARTTGTDSRAFGILGPDSHAVRLGSGLTPVASPTRIVHLAGCVEAVSEREDALLDWARERFVLSPLSHWRGLAPQRRARVAARPSDRSPVDEVERMDARTFFSELLRLVRDNPPDLDGRLLLDRLREITAAPELYPEVERGLRRGRAAIRAAARPQPGEASGRWEIGYAADADRVRHASAARAGLGVDPATEALTARLDADADGRPLTGECRYLLRFAPAQAPPVHGFWSLTARADDGTAYSIGDLRGLTLDLDGSLPIYIQHAPPARIRRSNWLPVPAGDFSIVLSLYWPAEAGAAARLGTTRAGARGLTARQRGAAHLDGVQFGGLLGRDEPDLDQVQRADEAVADPEAPGPHDRVAQRHGPVVLDQHQRGRGVVRDVLHDVPAVVLGEDVVDLRAEVDVVLAFDVEPDEGARRCGRVQRPRLRAWC